jgi:hypothetical protein
VDTPDGIRQKFFDSLSQNGETPLAVYNAADEVLGPAEGRSLVEWATLAEGFGLADEEVTREDYGSLRSVVKDGIIGHLIDAYEESLPYSVVRFPVYFLKNVHDTEVRVRNEEVQAFLDAGYWVEDSEFVERRVVG